MNILFLTLSNINSFDDQGIYIDLLNSLRAKGNNVYIVSPIEKRNRDTGRLIKEGSSYILKLKVGNITKTNMIEKGISTLLIEKQYINGIKKHFTGVTFDLVLYSTPPITLEKVIRYVKKRDKAKTYLLLKDIFPQNAVDLKILEPKGLKSIILKYFFRKEKRLYEISDYIGCMTKNNVDFILSNNEIEPQKVEICANSIYPVEIISEDNEKKEIRKKYGIPQNSVVFIYGGNLGKPQGIEFLLSNITKCKFSEAFFIIVGSGTEYNNLEASINSMELNNVLLISSLPKEEYNWLVSTADVGMIFLNPDFTIPNFPSRFLTYLQASLPVIAATDDNCDLQYLLEENRLGFWSNTRDAEKFKNNVKALLDADIRKENSSYSYSFLKENYDVSKASEIILNHFNME
ncbi:glycosyltransferase family 4 protein [Enterococcus sp. CWB-B31]|uniref:glycosyltransferase family 4 protein n=1 Tax=Enterococcus sp. CWB-B31 TaxID=2885159 RepID=UPI001E3BBB6D|nr:glycosyltransferase family 4 protein [Enterococcus sp. CWB-B31]MCB5954631.1 glycosyltransferase family 4 protein [Enterococcus sp. CWB-B31]